MSTTITIKNDGTITPFTGLYWTGESQFELLASTRDYAENVSGMNGTLDFGSEFDLGVITLECVSDDNLTVAEMNALKTTLAGQLYSILSYDDTLLTWESDSAKVLKVRLNGKPTITDVLHSFKVSIPLVCQPIWASSQEHSHTGNGTLVNTGTFETPVVIEIRGPCNNPSLVIGDYILSYTGALSSSDTLIIDTGALTCTFNEINALGNLTGLSSDVKLQPGDTTVSVPETGTTVFKWHDAWL